MGVILVMNNLKEMANRNIVYFLLIMFTVVSIFPFYYSIVTSLQPLDWEAGIKPDFIPDAFRLRNYVDAWAKGKFGRALFNSVFIAICRTFLHLIAAAMCGYAFAKREFPGKNILFSLFLFTIMIPPTVNIVPSYLIMKYFGWINTYLPLIIPGIGSVFGIFLVRQFMETLPDSLIEAARIDGYSEFGIFFRIVLPLSKPALATLAIFTFQGSYNDFMGPLIYLNKEELYTVQLALKAFGRFYNDASLDLILNNAANILISLPLIIFFIIFSRQFIEGIAVSGLKV